MKKNIFISSILMLFSMSVVSAYAEDLDNEIGKQEQKIDVIKKETKTIEEQKLDTDNSIKKIDAEIKEILENKSVTEKKANEISKEITELTIKINKRKELLRNQARDIQTSDSSNSLIETLLSSESISDAINKAVASITIMNASNGVVEQQQMDIKKSVALEKELEKKLTDIEDQSAELDKKQRNLVDIKLGQELELAELSLSLNTEEEKKQKLSEERDEAEKKKKLALEALEKQRKIEEDAKRMADLEVSKKRETIIDNSAENAELVDEKATKENPSETSKSEENVVSNEEKSNVDLSSKEKDVLSTEESSSSNTGWSRPLDSINISSRFGFRSDPTGYSGNQHDGLDFTGSTGTPIFSINSGEVVAAGYGPSTGNHVIIKHSNGMYSYYMHMSTPPAVSVGQSVSSREYLGGMGTTGNSTGVHLHLGMSTGLWSGFVDPATYIGL